MPKLRVARATTCPRSNLCPEAELVTGPERVVAGLENDVSAIDLDWSAALGKSLFVWHDAETNDTYYALRE